MAAIKTVEVATDHDGMVTVKCQNTWNILTGLLDPDEAGKLALALFDAASAARDAGRFEKKLEIDN